MIAIDLGSNTLRVVAYDCDRMQPVGAFEKIVKTADGLGRTGKIHADAVMRVVEALNEAKKTLPFANKNVVAVTTEAVRRATNAQEVLATIAKETGVHFQIIDGRVEANLTLLAVKERLHLLGMRQESFVLVDIGGGSTELTFVYATEVVSQSFPVGIVTTAQAYGTLAFIEEALPSLMQPMALFAKQTTEVHGKVTAFVATAGTPTTVAAMKLGQTYATYDPTTINGTTLRKEELRYYLDQLLQMPFAKREEKVGTGRSDLVAAGILIFEYLYTILKQKECIVIDDGLREGVAIASCRGLDIV